MTEFLSRALEEGARYGDDPWLFVRELVQNARDAGATRVDFRTEQGGGVERLACRDDGEGMSLGDARRYLLTLYASSKRRDGWAGRFGIGFWTVLRFAPERIRVRSAAADGRGWELEVDGRLERPRLASTRCPQGTEVVLERPARGGVLAATVRTAVTEMAPFPACRHHPRRPLVVAVDGEPVGRPFALAPPALHFRSRGLRGVVALGAEPRVELFAYGLKVREATHLDDLLADAPAPLEGPADGAVPRALLDSDRLEVLLARGDARDDRALRRLVAEAQREVRRLVAAELDRIAPRTWPARLVDQLPRTRGVWVAALAGVLLAVGGGLAVRHRLAAQPVGEPSAAPPAIVVAGARPYVDPVRSYRGPQNDALPRTAREVDLRYSPSGDLLLGVARLDSPRAVESLDAAQLRTAAGPLCERDCVEVTLRVAGGGRLRLPVPPGRRVDPTSVRLGRHALVLLEDRGGDPVVQLPEGVSGRLRYRAGAAPTSWPTHASRWPALPARLRSEIEGWGRLPTGERVARATALVQRTVRYRVGGPRLGDGELVAAALAAGAGDCDVQNAVLATVLTRLGVPARLAVGYVGRGDRVRPFLHAWVEYLDGDRVEVADASAGGGSAAPLVQGGGGREVAPGGAAAGALPAALAALGGVLLLAVAGALALLAGSRRRRRLDPGSSPDAAELLRGVLSRERPWRGAEVLLRRPLVPLVGGGSMALSRARRLAAASELSASRRGSAFARAAAALGAQVVDAARPAGRVVADALGLADLDGFATLLERRTSAPLAEEVNRLCSRLGAQWGLAVVSGAPAPLTVLPRLPARLTGFAGELVLVDGAGALWQGALRTWPERPAAARFLLADVVVHQLLPPGRARRSLLAFFARRTIEEASGGG